jgi:hypothetical protein
MVTPCHTSMTREAETVDPRPPPVTLRATLRATATVSDSYANRLELDRLFRTVGSFACHSLDYKFRIVVVTVGDSHDQADAEWIVIRTQLRGHNDTPFGWPAPGRPSGRPGSGRPSGVFCML